MQPPWITFELLLILSLSALNVGNQHGSDVNTGNAAANAAPNVAVREAMEREKKHIPYVTYYVTRSRSEPRFEAALDAVTTTTSSVPNPKQHGPSIFHPTFTEGSQTGPRVHSSAGLQPFHFQKATGGMRKPNEVKVSAPPKFAILSQNPPLRVPQLIRIVPVIVQWPMNDSNQRNQSIRVDLGAHDSRIGRTDPTNRPRPLGLAVNDFSAANAKATLGPDPHTSFGSRGVNPFDQTLGKSETEVTSAPRILLSLPNVKHNKEIRKERLPRLRVPQESEIRFVVNLTPMATGGDKSTALPGLGAAETHSTTNNDFNRPTLDGFLSVLSETSKLPKNLTPHNIDNGIKVLAFILERLQKEKQVERKQQAQSPQLASVGGRDEKSNFEKFKKHQNFPQESGTSTPGRAGIDYPTYSSIPQTSFDCSTQRYKGFFGDPETECQVWHYCDLNGGQASFLCPNGTIFSQAALTCDWWFNVKCASTSQLYVLNERLYKYILPFSPSFPEDYSGPIVDRYLRAKFNEMERKSKVKALKSSSTKTAITTTPTTITTTTNSPTQSGGRAKGGQ